MEWMDGSRGACAMLIGGSTRACGGLSNRSIRLFCLAMLRATRVGELPGVLITSVSESEWNDRAGEGGVVVLLLLLLLLLLVVIVFMLCCLCFCWWRCREIVVVVVVVVAAARCLATPRGAPRRWGEVWIRIWRVNSSEREKRFSHPGKLQWCGFSPVCVRMWRVWCSRR